jgi:DNA-directed RNA polymerase specialized sigma24 family protein
MTITAGRVRSEVELFNTLATSADAADLEAYRRRILKCVLWLLTRRPTGSLVAGDVPDMVDEVIARLEEHLRPRGTNGTARQYAGTDKQFRRYLYRTVVSVHADTARLRRRLRSLDAPIVTRDGTKLGPEKVLDGLVEWPTASDALGRPDLQTWVQQTLQRLPERCRRWLLAIHRDDVPIADIARRHAVCRNTADVALSRFRACFRQAFVDTVLATDDARFRARVDEAARRLSGAHATVFRACWTERRDVAEAATALGLARHVVRARLAEAKERVWRMLPEGGLA